MTRTFLLFAAFLGAVFPGFSQPSPRLAALIEGQEIGRGVVHARIRAPKPFDAAARQRLLAQGLRLGPALDADWVAVVIDLKQTPNALLESLAVEPVPAAAKLSAELRQGIAPDWALVEARGQSWVDVDVVYHEESGKTTALLGLQKLQGTVLEEADYFHRLRVRFPLSRIKELAARQWVRAVEPIPAPSRELSNATSASLLGVDAARTEFNVQGQGVRVAVVDGGAVDIHPDLEGRVVVMNTRSLSRHATHVAGTIAGSGLSDPGLRGMAPQATIMSYDFSGDIPLKFLRARTEDNVAVANNSWGLLIGDSLGNCSSYGAYGVRESEIDRVVRNEGLTVVFAAGNDRDSPECTIAPRAGFYSMARPATAKNVLTIAAIDGATAVSQFSGFGPARDGRLKPELTALGVDVRSLDTAGRSQVLSGTSMSSPAISGLATLLVNRFRQDNSGQTPEPALVRALLMNTARDLGNPGPDYTHGYGLPDAHRAFAALTARRFTRDQVAKGATREIEIDVPAGTPALRVLAAWDDREGWPGEWRALVNDLDLELVSPSGETVLPLTLDAARPEADAAPAVNRRDNAEQALVRNPASGRWIARLRGHDMADDSQRFALTWSFDDVPQPECLTTVTPSSLDVAPEGGAPVVSVARPNFCGDWTPAVLEAGWLRPSSTTPRSGSASFKVNVDPNLELMRRQAVIEVAGRAVAVRQSPACAVNPIAFGETIESGLTEFDCMEDDSYYLRAYEFTAEAGQAISASLTSSQFDTYLFLIGPNQSLIAENDDAVAGSTNSRIPASGSLTLPLTGRYLLVVSSFAPEETGLFQLSLREEPRSVTAAPVRPVSACPAEIEGELSNASGRDGRRGDLFPVEVFRFRGRMGQRLIAELRTAAWDSVLYLIDPMGRQIAFNDDDPSDADSRLELDLPMNGLYRLEISGFGLRDLGPFRLLLQGCEPLEP